MKKNVDIAKLDPVVKIAPGEKLKQGKKFSLTAKRKRKLNVKYVMFKNKEKAWFMSQNTVAEETVRDVKLHNTKGAIELTKRMPIICFK